jgi:hypothetical protein
MERERKTERKKERKKRPRHHPSLELTLFIDIHSTNQPPPNQTRPEPKPIQSNPPDPSIPISITQLTYP